MLAGGHTVDDKEPKYGLSVLGVVHPDRVLTKAGAQPGDTLVLTKPLGAGIVTTAFKGGVAEPDHVAAATASMAALNRGAAQLAQRVGIHAATDITGFGLLGHASEMANLGKIGLRLHLDRLPFLPGAREYAEQWLFPAGANRNQDYFGCSVAFAPEISDEVRLLLFTPETSGGLLMATPAERLNEMQALATAVGQPLWIIGEAVEGVGIEIVL